MQIKSAVADFLRDKKNIHHGTYDLARHCAYVVGEARNISTMELVEARSASTKSAK